VNRTTNFEVLIRAAQDDKIISFMEKTTMKLPRILLLVVLVILGLGIAGSKAGQTEFVYPGKEWKVKKPQEVALDVKKLKELSDYAGGFGCVVRHGYMVYSWGDAGKRNDVASAAKPVYAHLLFKAVEQGRIYSLDEKVNKCQPQLNQINKDLDYKDRDITWRHLANQTSCYGLTEKPGTAFAYNDWQMALFWDTLFQKVYGATYETVDANVLHPELTDLIGCQDNPTFMAFGVKDRPGRLAISPRDFARFGLLYLRQGKWKNKQLISRGHAIMAVSNPLPNSIPRTAGQEAELIPGQRSIGSMRIPDNQCDHLGSYSWLWWTNGLDREGKRHWPDAPVDTYGCFGHGGKRAMVVMPSLDLIVSWNDTKIQASEMENHALKLLKDSVTHSELPGYSVERLPQYEKLFYREKGWTGADAAYSVALVDNVTLWLYGDTWIGDIIDGKHNNATMVNNSIGLQQGKDPATASVDFFWGTSKEGKPAAFIRPADGIGWFWIFHGVAANKKLYLFLMQIIKTDEKSVFGFKQIGTWLGQVENPLQEPGKWQIKQYKVPFGRYSDKGNLFFGSAVMKDGDFVYIYGASEDWKKGMSGRSMIVARARPEEMTEFDKWRFFDNGNWQSDVNDISGLFDGIATEYSVSYQPKLAQYVVIYTENGMSENIMMRLSPTPVGPWSQAYKIYQCPESKWHKTYFCYAAKGHPEISDKDELIITYVCNSTDFWQMVADARIYWQRFLKVKFDVGLRTK